MLPRFPARLFVVASVVAFALGAPTAALSQQGQADSTRAQVARAKALFRPESPHSATAAAARLAFMRKVAEDRTREAAKVARVTAFNAARPRLASEVTP